MLEVQLGMALCPVDPSYILTCRLCAELKALIAVSQTLRCGSAALLWPRKFAIVLHVARRVCRAVANNSGTGLPMIAKKGLPRTPRPSG